MMVAYARAVAHAGASHVRDFRDPTARVFLGEEWLARLGKIEDQLESGRETMRLAFARVGADLMALRASAIDAAVRDAVARGVTQVVILGAGLDGRAWRMSELAGVRVFEVDHPASQGLKRLRVGALPPSIADVTFVSVDFEHESLDAALARAGHDGTRATCWIWEGVVMYLTPDVVRSTLANIAKRSAEGSTLIVNYHTTMRRGFIRLLFRALGEPVKSKWSPDEMAEALRAVGFVVVEDSGVEDWAKRFATGTVNMAAARVMRIVVAETVVIRKSLDDDFVAMLATINDAAHAYRGVIPADRCREPYMPADELAKEIADGVVFWVAELDGRVTAVMGIQDKGDVALVRHAYVAPTAQRTGVGTRLLRHVEDLTGKPILIGTWAAATWAIEFYRRNGFTLVSSSEKDRLLQTYWSIPARQIETSVVLANGRWLQSQARVG